MINLVAINGLPLMIKFNMNGQYLGFVPISNVFIQKKKIITG